MIICGNCGTHFDGRFCPSCGAAANPAPPPPFSAASPLQNPMAAGLSPRWAAVICYLVPIAGPIVFLFLAPYNREPQSRFHAWQALFLQLVWMAAHMVANVFAGLSWRVADGLHQMIGLAYFATVVVLAVKAYQGDRVLLPWIGPMAARQK